jgi:hypothetical protein
MNTGIMIADVIKAGKFKPVKASARDWTSAMQQFKNECQAAIGSPVEEKPASDAAPEQSQQASRMRWMFLSGKDRAVRVIKL